LLLLSVGKSRLVGGFVMNNHNTGVTKRVKTN
jgi:hypothetical protein